jgi:hypothetical protein
MSAGVPGRPNVARRVLETDAAIQHELAMLMERIAPLTGGCDETAESFGVLRSRWLADASRLHSALDDIAASVEDAR